MVVPHRLVIAAFFAAAPAAAHAESATDCGGCHADVTTEWSDSMHRRSFSDETFLAEYRPQPLAFCRGCHAPLGDPSGEPGALAAHEGVSCTSCHDPRAAHEVGRDRRAANSDACARCHDFSFPQDGEYDPRGRMQRTFREWAASDSAHRGEACVDCHMPWRTEPGGGRHRDHRVLGLRDADFVRSAVRPRVSARRVSGAMEVRTVLAAGRIGHAFPTGDLFRRLELRVTAPRAEAFRAVFGRVFAPMLSGDRFRLREVADERVPPPGAGAARARSFRLPGATSATWTLDYLRRPADLARRLGIPDERNRIRIGSGVTRLID
jgi:hypothetical protein